MPFPIYHPHINAVTWGYAVFFWDDHFMGSGPPQDELLKALQSFNVFGCYIDTLGPQRMQEECWNTIKRVASPRLSVLGKIAQKLQVFYLIYLYNGTEIYLIQKVQNKKYRSKGSRGS